MIIKTSGILYVLCVCSVRAVRECIQPIRQRIWDPLCYEAEVPRTIARAEEASCQPSTSDVCSFVAEAIHADIPVFDMVLINRGSCNHVDIQQGLFTHHEASQVLPYQNELVGLLLQGKDIIIALEHGISASLMTTKLFGAYPTTAGVRFEVDTTREKGGRVSQVEIMKHNCEYEPLDPEKYYTVLTNQYLARGGDGYGVFPLMAKSTIPTRISETDSFWFHAHSTCRLETPWKTKRQLKAENVLKKPKMIYMVGQIPGPNMTASVI